MCCALVIISSIPMQFTFISKIIGEKQRRQFGHPIWFVDGLWLCVLMSYVVAGMPLATFHPDETERIHRSVDYATIFIEGDLASMIEVTDPVTGKVKASTFHSLLAAPLQSYITGFMWHLAGFSPDDLPPSWHWGRDFKTNIAEGRRPSESLLNIGRFASTLFLCLTVVLVYAFGRIYRGRILAYFVSGVYALNPVVLLHGRRAMYDAPFVFWGILMLLLALLISRKHEQQLPVSRWWWVGFILSGALGIAAKQTGVIFVVIALAWVFVVELSTMLFTNPWRDTLRRAFSSGLQLSAYGIMIIVIVFLLTPVFWSNPIARLNDHLDLRIRIVQNQVKGTKGAPMSLAKRVEFIVTQPFIHPANRGHDADETERYLNSVWYGVRYGTVGGLGLMLLAGYGIIVVLWPSLRLHRDQSLYTGLLIWLVAMVVFVLMNPLPWQRYYYPLIPVITLLAGLGLQSLIDLIIGKWHVKTIN